MIQFMSRELLWALIAIGIAVLLAYVLVLLTPHDVQSEPRASAAPSIYEERLLQLDRQATEAAYVEHIKKLFGIWMTDYSSEPPKGIRGANQARSAYDRAMTAIEVRERALVNSK